VRSDFYADIQNHDGLRAAVQDSQVSLGPMNEEELRAVIEGPAMAIGAKVDSSLTKRLIRDIGLDPTSEQHDQYDIGKLPLLEYTLEQAWAKRTGLEIGLGQYAGLEQALEQRANELYEKLSLEQQAAAKRLFVRLVTPGEGREDTRARRTLAEDPTTLAVVDVFAGERARLLVTGEIEGTRSAEISHEALIRHWDRLRHWIDENRENLRIYDALLVGRKEWFKNNQDGSLLIQSGLRLEAARKLRDHPGDVDITEIKDYIEASIQREEHEQNERDEQRRRAIANESRVLAALSRVAASSNQPVDAIKLGLAAWPRRVDDDRPRLEIALQGLSDALKGKTLKHDDSIFGSRWSRYLSWSSLSRFKDRNLLPIEQVGSVLKHDSSVDGALWSRNEQRVLSWAWDTLRLWDLTTEKQIGRAMRHEGSVLGALWSHDESRILSWSEDRTLRFWDLTTGKQIGTAKRHEGSVSGALWSHDESRILSWSRDRMQFWDATGGQPMGSPMRHEGSVSGALWSHHESRILSWSDDKTLRLWDVASGKEIGPAMRHEGSVSGALWSHDESRILSWSQDDTLRLWDVAGKQIGPTMRHNDDSPIRGVLWSRNEGRILSWSPRTFYLWDAASSQQIGPAMRHNDDSPIHGVLWSRNEGRILSWSPDTLYLWDAASSQQIGPAVQGEVSGALWSRHEVSILSWSDDMTLRLWQVPWPNGSVLEVACALLPDSDLTDVSRRYGIFITEPICTPEQLRVPLDWSTIERAPATIADAVLDRDAHRLVLRGGSMRKITAPTSNLDAVKKP
jgi:WD40 repeat protein